MEYLGAWGTLIYVRLPLIQFIAGGVIDTGEQFIAGVNDTGDNIFPRCR